MKFIAKEIAFELSQGLNLNLLIVSIVVIVVAVAVVFSQYLKSKG